MARIANHKIDEKLANWESFENYNSSIHAIRSGERYSVVHWNTVILDYNIETQTIDSLALGYISQTTSTLLGRIIRALPKSVVFDLMAKSSHYDKKRIERMARLYY
jgi:hypothetical protein